MPKRDCAKHYVAVIPGGSAHAAGLRGHRNICATATFSQKCCAQHFYDYRQRGARRHDPATPFPRWATVIGERLRPFFEGAMPEQCIVNEYRPGQGIGMHADHQSFGPVVVSLSLAAAWTMHFRPRSQRPYVRGGLPSDEVVLLPRRSALVLRGLARSAWMHGIDPAAGAGRSETRVSATFRTLVR